MTQAQPCYVKKRVNARERDEAVPDVATYSVLPLAGRASRPSRRVNANRIVSHPDLQPTVSIDLSNASALLSERLQTHRLRGCNVATEIPERVHDRLLRRCLPHSQPVREHHQRKTGLTRKTVLGPLRNAACAKPVSSQPKWAYRVSSSSPQMVTQRSIRQLYFSTELRPSHRFLMADNI